MILHPAKSHTPQTHTKTPKKAAASGWIGSALEYYDFFIYAQAAALAFPSVFFPSDNPRVGIVASFATFGVGYIARPVGAFLLGHWGDTRGRRSALIASMLLMGLSTLSVAALPTYDAVGIWAPVLLVVLRLVQGFAVGGEISGASAMILEHAPFGRRAYFASFALQGVQAGQIIAAAAFLPLAWALAEPEFLSWGWRIPFLLSGFVVVVGYIIRRSVSETPAFAKHAEQHATSAAPILLVVKENGIDMLRVVGMALMNAIPTTVTIFGATYATNPAYGVELTAGNYLWIALSGNVVAVLIIPYVANLADRVGRRPVIVGGCLGSGALGYVYLYFVSDRNFLMTFLIAILMWGIVYQGYNAVFPAFYQELFPTKTRVTGFAVAQNLGTLITAFLPSIYAALVGPTPSSCVENHTFVADHVLPSSRTCQAAAEAIKADVIWVVGSITLGLSCLAAIAAISARETYRVHLDHLGYKKAVPVLSDEYQRMRKKAMAKP
ncbi:MFS transporter [Mycobacterium sp.]|uniref:MFS transporter n=1 Tax=Mycobacterium sp. TaxID=1785 RepID=UPI003BAAF957